MRQLGLMMLLFIIPSCNQKKDESVVAPPTTVAKIVVPDRIILGNDTNISRKGNLIYYKDTLYSGFVELQSPSHTLISKAGYWQGKLEGKQEQWYENGAAKEIRYYAANKKVGIHTGWWDNGNKKFSFEFENDLPINKHYEWYRSGKLYSLLEYSKEGQPEGVQQLWFEDGTVKSNYVVKNNRRFGFLGAKGCEMQPKNK